jgi:hypothetical protein
MIGPMPSRGIRFFRPRPILRILTKNYFRMLITCVANLQFGLK